MVKDNVLCQNVVTFFVLRKKKRKKRKRKSRIIFNLGYQKKKRDILLSHLCFPVSESFKRRRRNNHTHTHRHMFAATNIISTPTNTTSLFSSTRRHHQPSSSRRPHPFFVCASSLKSTQKQQEKDDRKTVDDVDRRDVLTKAALVASVAMTTMTPKPVRARTFCKRRRRR